MSNTIVSPPAPRGKTRPRPVNSRDAVAGHAQQLFGELLETIERRNGGQSRDLLRRLRVAGHTVQPLAGTDGLRLVAVTSSTNTCRP